MGKKRAADSSSSVSSPPARTLLRLGIFGVAFFGVVMVLLHMLNWGEMALHGRHVSNFAHMPGWWLWQAGLVGLGGGTLLIGMGLRRSLPVSGPPRWGFRALELAGLCVVGMMMFKTDRIDTPGYNTTFSGYVHDSFAVMSTFLICWSMLLFVAAARVDPAWRGVPGRGWTWPVATVSLALVWMLGDVTPYWRIGAVVQRGVVLVMAAWLITTGWRALAAAQGRATGTPQPTPPPRPTR